MKGHVLFICLICLLSATSSKADIFGIYQQRDDVCTHIDMTKKLTLSDVMEMAICQNPELKMSYLSTQISGAGYGISLSNYLPSVTLTGSIGHETGKEDAGTSEDGSDISANARLNWLLLDFGERGSTRRKMKAFLESADHSYNNSLQTLLYNVSNAYYALLSAKENHEGLLKSEEASKKAYEEASSRHTLGLVPLSDKLQAETAYAQAQLATTIASKQIRLRQGELANLLNVSPDTHFKLTRPSKKISDTDSENNFKKMIQMALDNREDLKALQKDVYATKENITAIRSEGLPTLSASASSGLSDDIRDGNRNHYTGSIGLTLSFPIFTGFSQSYKEGQARFEYERMKSELLALENRIQNDVWTAIQEYETSFKTHTISQTLLKSAEESERVAFASYKVGKMNIISLLDAQSQLAQARVEYSTSFYNFLTSKATLLKALGKMEKIK